MNAANYIHIALLGPVSAGKTTLLNALLVERYGDMAMKRTTMTEAIYYECEDEKHTTAADIHAKNAVVNAQLYEKAKSGGLTAADLKPIEHFVPPVHDLLTKKLHAGTKLAIHDLPGLNDAQTKTMYHDYVAANFHKYNIVILVLDVNSGMNTSDEKDILTLIANGIWDNKTKFDIETSLVVVINKCDDMEVKDRNSYETIATDPEYVAMVKQVRATINSTVTNIAPTDPIRFVCLSTEDSYIYRMYSRNPDCEVDQKYRNKFGINAFGKHTWAKMTEAEKIAAFQLKVREKNVDAIELAGFRHLDWKLANILTKENQFKFLIAQFKVRMAEIKYPNSLDRSQLLDVFVKDDMIKFKQIKLDMGRMIEIFGPCSQYQEAGYGKYFDAYLVKYEGERNVHMKPTVIARDQTVFSMYKNLYEIMTIAHTDLRSWFITPHANKLETIAMNINSNIIIEMHDVTKTEKELEQLYSEILLPDSPVPEYIKPLLTNRTLRYGVESTVRYAIVYEIVCQLWKYDKLDWYGIIRLVNAWFGDHDIEGNIKILLEITLDCILNTSIASEDRWNAIDVFSRYYINYDFLEDNIEFGSCDLKYVRRYLRSPPDSVKNKPLHNDNIKDVIEHCLSKLNELYPKHIVDLDVFYAGPRNRLPLYEFYPSKDDE